MPEEIYRAFRQEFGTGDYVFGTHFGTPTSDPLGMVVRVGDLAGGPDSSDPLILTTDHQLRSLPDILQELQVDIVAWAEPVDRPAVDLVCDVAAGVIRDTQGPGDPLVSYVRDVLIGQPRDLVGSADVTEFFSAQGDVTFRVEPMMVRMRCAAHNNVEICPICG